MNCRLSIALLLLASGLAHAQQQERKLEERIMKPDMTLSANEQKRGFSGGKSFSTSNASGDKHYSGLRQFSLKSFFTHSYSGEKNFWTPEYKPAQKIGNLDKPGDSGKTFETKTLPVSNAREAAKGYASTNTYKTMASHEEGKSQKALDQQRVQKEMSIDEIRDLLNKSK